MGARNFPKTPAVDSGGGPPDDDKMAERVSKLEETYRAVREDVAVIRSNYATAGDLHKAISEQTWKLVTWVTTIAAALVGITYFLASHVKP